jgi:hypothetical protein
MAESYTDPLCPIPKAARIAIKEFEGQQILDYLQDRPYKEVYPLIAILMRAERISDG